jgi:hypothetical protein
VRVGLTVHIEAIAEALYSQERVMGGVPGCAIGFLRVPGVGWIHRGAATMTRSLVVGLAILTLSTSAALAAQRTHHRHAMNAYAAVPATPAPATWTGGVSSSDHAMYIRNLRDSGYNTKNNFNASGNLATQ